MLAEEETLRHSFDSPASLFEAPGEEPSGGDGRQHPPRLQGAVLVVEPGRGRVQHGLSHDIASY